MTRSERAKGTDDVARRPSSCWSRRNVPTLDEEWADLRHRAWNSFREAIAERGFLHPPTSRQQDALWPIVDARPADVARWIREGPPGLNMSQLVGVVIRCSLAATIS